MTNDPPEPLPVLVPLTELSPATLERVLHDLVTRDGTDYGAVERTTEQKIAALRRLLERDEAQLVFDPATETISVLTRAEADALPR